MGKKIRVSYLLNAVGVVLVFAVLRILFSAGVFGTSTTYIQGICTTACYTIIMVASLNLVVGFMGEFSLGHAGFVSVGAYASAIVSGLLTGKGLPDVGLFLVALLAGGLAAGIMGVLVGIPALRLRGDYLAIVTMAFAEIIRVCFCNFAITGGGSYVGKKLAADYGIDLYDRKLLRLASDDSGISEAVFARADENTRKTLLYKVSQKIYDGKLIPPESGNFTSDENLFNYQSKVLRELLDCESYVCVGWAADFVLRDKPNVLTVYIDAPYEKRVAREVERQGISRWEASHYIDRLDRYRESYYKYHTGRQWKVISNYDLCLDSAALGLDNCVEIIEKAVELKFGVKAPK